MGANDKAREAMDETKGKIKEGWGELTDNEKLQSEGRAEQAHAKAEQLAEDERAQQRRLQDDSGIENR
jgi:uncharacterized protein YjbJ (UPF0337 family)